MSPEAAWPWHVLGLPGLPRDEAEIRRAYARALKKIDQARDIEGFTALRQAFETALAMRAGRTRQNTARQERRATAAAVPTPEAAPADPTPPPAPPPPDPEQIAAQGREDEFQRLARLVELDNLLTPYSARLMAALEHPLSRDPAYEGRIRVLIVESLRMVRWRDRAGEVDLASRLTTGLVQALDARYGWVSDFAAFRRDFGSDPELLELLLDRGNVRQPAPAVGKARGGFVGWLNGLDRGAKAAVLFGFVIALRGLIEAASRATDATGNPWPVRVLVALFMLPLAYGLYLVLRDIAGFIRHAPARLWRRITLRRMRIEDWFALRRRRKGRK